VTHFVHDGTSWRPVEPVVHDGSQVRQVSDAWVWDGSMWRLFYNRTPTEAQAGLTLLDPVGTVVAGGAYAVTGTLLDLADAPVVGATVAMSYSIDHGLSWIAAGQAVTDPAGNLSFPFQYMIAGSIRWRGTYTPTDGSPSVVGMSAGRIYGLAAAGPLKKGSLTYTAATVSWPAVVGATAYEVWRNNVLVATVTGLSYTSSGLASNTSYSFKVRAKATPPSGVVLGAFSASVTANTGRVQQKDTGTKDVRCKPEDSGSYRTSDNWSELGKLVAQGTPGNDPPYRGVIDYGTTGARADLRAGLGGGSLGQNRQENGSCTAAQVWLSRHPNYGRVAKVTVGFFTCDQQPGGAAPDAIGARVDRESTPRDGGGKWYQIGSAHGQRLGDGANRSILVRMDAEGEQNYAVFRGIDWGQDGNNLDLILTWKWDYVTVVGIPPSWS